MEAIAPKSTLGVAVLLLLLPSAASADRAADVRSQISHIATSLASGNAADALQPFDKSYADYEKLSGYFQGLAVRQVDNEIDITDEDDSSDTETKVTINWNLTLTDPVTNRTDQRTANINARLVLEKGKWKIVDFSPIEIFNPVVNWKPKS